MTILDYSENERKTESEADFLEVRETNDGIAVVLDRTIFRPASGKRPSDRGEIVFAEGLFVVDHVRMETDKTVLHFGHFKREIFSRGESVKLTLA